ncbi:MAG TPA: hypothetical protein VJU61_18465 [Polyangiaceae bacterium]|nr:hypothetical protein [Polyangiaceae bacterium]
MKALHVPGKRRALLLVCGMLFLNYTTAFELIPWQWPIVAWQMYRAKAHTERVVSYRRLLTHRRDGSHAPTSNCSSLTLIEYPYRLDYILATDTPRFLTTCLRELKRSDPNVLGASLEKRSWRYGEQSLEEHLQQAASRSFRATELPQPLPAALREPRPAEELVKNGGFTRSDGSGELRVWNTKQNQQGIGVDLASGERTLLLPRQRGDKPSRVVQEVKLPPTLVASVLRLRLLALAGSEGATVVLELPSLGKARASIPHDGTWQRVELLLDSAARPAALKATVELINGSSGDVFFDDVSLTEAPAPAKDAPAPPQTEEK